MSDTNSLLPLDTIYLVLDYLTLTNLSKIKSSSKIINYYFKNRLRTKYNNFYNIVNNQSENIKPKQTIQPTLPITNFCQTYSQFPLIISPLPTKFKPNIHIIYHILKKLERPNNFFRMISPTTFYQHLLPRYSTMSGMIPFIKIPTAMGFYKLISVYPFTSEPEFFVSDSLGGMCTRDREFNLKHYYTRTLQSYQKPMTFTQMFQTIVNLIE